MDSQDLPKPLPPEPPLLDHKISCRCGYHRITTGKPLDLKDLVEVAGCQNCGGPRKYKCPRCGSVVKPFKVRNIR